MPSFTVCQSSKLGFYCSLAISLIAHAQNKWSPLELDQRLTSTIQTFHISRFAFAYATSTAVSPTTYACKDSDEFKCQPLIAWSDWYIWITGSPLCVCPRYIWLGSDWKFKSDAITFCGLRNPTEWNEWSTRTPFWTRSVQLWPHQINLPSYKLPDHSTIENKNETPLKHVSEEVLHLHCLPSNVVWIKPTSTVLIVFIVSG